MYKKGTMNKGFWGKLKKPIIALAPLANVTDAAFRRIIVKYGKPDVMFTEFTSADGLFSGDKKAYDVLMYDLIFAEEERPIIAQFFTAKPEMMKKAAARALELGFDGVDINMGCPDRSVEKQRAGAALIKNPGLAQELIAAAQEGAGVLPVSVKTRMGYNTDNTEEWIGMLLEMRPAAITLHARTRKEMSKVPAHWGAVTQAVGVRDKMKSETLILGNGDVDTVEEAIQKTDETGADGIMIGRGIFGNPWLFTPLHTPQADRLRDQRGRQVCKGVPVGKRLKIMVEHARLFEELLGNVKNFAIMKKHFKAYASGFPACAGRDGAKELRIKLMEARNAKEVEMVVLQHLQNKKTGITKNNSSL